MLDFGFNKFDKYNRIIWDNEKVTNSHMMLVGSSGTGKTHTLRKIIESFDFAKKIFIIDVHGDIEVDGATTIEFNESSEFGVNPIKLDSDRDFGGVRKNIRNFITMLNRTSRKLGTKQEPVLINLLYDLYSANGFYTDNPQSWNLNGEHRGRAKRYPTVQDLMRFSKWKYGQMLTGASSKAFNALERLNKEYQNMNRKNLKNILDEGDLNKKKEVCVELYKEYINEIETGGEIEELIKYDSKDILKSVYDRILTIESSGIFKGKDPFWHTRDDKIVRFNIKALNKDEQQMFVDIVVEHIFLELKKRGEVPFADTFVFIDEAHNFTNDDGDHIINIAIKEGRKFGLGEVLSSQSFTHFPEDIISNSATKIILGLDEMYHKSTSSKLMIDAKKLGYITPHKSALIQIKNKGNTSNRFIDCVF